MGGEGCFFIFICVMFCYLDNVYVFLYVMLSFLWGFCGFEGFVGPVTCMMRDEGRKDRFGERLVLLYAFIKMNQGYPWWGWNTWTMGTGRRTLTLALFV